MVTDQEQDAGPADERDASAVPADRVSDDDKALAKRIHDRIKKDRTTHGPAFKRMKRSMKIARTGRVGDNSGDYVANIVGRHLKRKVAALYAKNPKAVAGRRPTLDFAVWDENPESLQQAMMVLQQTQMAAAAGLYDSTAAMAALQAQELLADVQQGMARRTQLKRIGRTAEVLFDYFMREDQPLDFKTEMKRVVRRAATNGVGYVELMFERRVGAPPEAQAQLTDAKERLAVLQSRIETAFNGGEDYSADDAGEFAETRAAIQALQNEPEIVLREGLVFGYPRSTMVLPDSACTNLVGFEGAGHLTIGYYYTREEVKALFGVEVGGKAEKVRDDADTDVQIDTAAGSFNSEGPHDAAAPLVLVYKHYDKRAGLVYYLAEDFPGLLRPPAPPDVFVDTFWPVYALTFNATEEEDAKCLFPLSDVELLEEIQAEYNQSRQGKREHRAAARPRWVSAAGMLSEEDKERLQFAHAFSVTELNLPNGADIRTVLQAVPIPGVDPNLYDVGEIMADFQMVGGGQEALYGATSQATATESAIAAGSTGSTDEAAVEDLDAFLTRIARAGCQIMLRELSAEQAKVYAGPGALWPDAASLEDIAREVYLEVEAGSSGRPNQAMEIKALEQIGPLLLQIPGISPLWFAREAVKRFDDRADLTEAVLGGVSASIVAMNANTQPATADATQDPAAQGAAGAQNSPQPPGGPTGSGAAFGSNQV